MKGLVTLPPTNLLTVFANLSFALPVRDGDNAALVEPKAAGTVLRSKFLSVEDAKAEEMEGTEEKACFLEAIGGTEAVGVTRPVSVLGRL